MTGKRKVVKKPSPGQQGNQNVGRRRKAALQYIKEMPLDILFEIFVCLEPRDLLRISRTSKDLRNILMSKSSLFIWRTSRKNASVPDPFPRMSEPAFAHLLFDPHCHFCSTAIVQTIIWEAMCRCCNRCLDSAFMAGSDVDDELYQKRLRVPDEMWRLFPRFIPVTIENQKNFTVYRTFILFNNTHYLHGDEPDRDMDGSYLRSETRRIIRSYEELTVEQRQQWLQAEVEVTEAQVKHILECRKWQSNEYKRQEIGRDAAKEERFKAVVQRLEDAGWKEDLSLPRVREKLRYHKLVNQPKPLTDRIWRNIAPKLDEFFRVEIPGVVKAEQHRIRRLRIQALISFLSEHEQHLPRDLAMPALSDIVLWQPIRTIIEAYPVTVSTSRSIFDAVTPQLPSFIQDWNDSGTQIVLESLQRHRPRSTKDDLLLSTSLFRCTKSECRASESIFSYPAILFHICTKDSPLPEEWGWFPTPAMMGAGRKLLTGFSSPSLQVEIELNAALTSESICQLSDLDPATTTLDSMFKFNPIVECRACMTKDGNRLFMRWTTAIYHTHYRDFRAITAVERSNVELRERGTNERIPCPIRCKHCTFKAKKTQNIKKHLSSSHGISSIQDEDWEFRPLSDPIEPETGPTSVWIPARTPSKWVIHQT
ncbi:hypothetical protein PQX77_017760 [Marasmius sp. AFHP31]|nr:hypothetical protein PQX77_017760 [Marasmius sp. AFHP31]